MTGETERSADPTPPFVLVAGPTEPNEREAHYAAELGSWLGGNAVGLVTGGQRGIATRVSTAFDAAGPPRSLLPRGPVWIVTSREVTGEAPGEVHRTSAELELPFACEVGAVAALLGEEPEQRQVLRRMRALGKPAFALEGTRAERLVEEAAQLVSLEQLFAELSRLRVPPEPSSLAPWSGPPLVLVTGPFEANRATRDAAERTARWLAERGFGLLTGGYPGVDATAALAFAAALSPDQHETRLVQVVGTWRAPATRLGRLEWVGGKVEDYERAAYLAACGVLIGNSPGTAGTAVFLRKAGRPVLAFPGTGADDLPATEKEGFASEPALFERLATLLSEPEGPSREQRATSEASEPRRRDAEGGHPDQVEQPEQDERLGGQPLRSHSAEGAGSTAAKQASVARAEPTPTPQSSASLTLRIGAQRAALHSPSQPNALWSANVDLSRLDVTELVNALPELDEEQARMLGDELATALFGPKAPSTVVNALNADLGTVARLVLELDPVAALQPWEYLRVVDQFLLERRVSVVRRVESTARARPLHLPSAGGMTILFAWANPEESAFHRFDDREHTTQLERARPPRWAIKPVPRSTPESLRRELMKQDDPYDILHFLGHGRLSEGGGKLVLHSDDPKQLTGEVPANVLATWLGAGQPKLVVLGSCYAGASLEAPGLSGVAEAIVRATGVPVVAMQSAVPQDFSTAFLAEFYRLLAAAEGDIEKAVHGARQISSGGRMLFGLPVLHAADYHAPPPALEAATYRFGPRVELVSASQLGALLGALPEAQEIAERASKNLPDKGLFRVSSEGERTLRGVVAELARVARAHKAVEQADLEKLEHLEPSLRSTSSRPLRPPRVRPDSTEPLWDPPLELGWAKLTPALAEIDKRLVVPPGLTTKIAAELLAGRHVLLVGPVGTGKSSLAVEIVKAMGYSELCATASSDWTPHEVVGGFWPQTVVEGDKSRLELRFRPGHVTEAILMNWEETPPRERGGQPGWSRRLGSGTWLVLDELNRADMDRAMGPLFTALETRRLRLSVEPREGEPSTAELYIPKDFRILATLNGVDRHYLFRLSDALKRRFAWVEVPATMAWAREWELLSTNEHDDPAADLVKRLVYLTRFAFPLGTAQLKAALAFLRVSRGSNLGDEARVEQAALGSVLPSLEEAPASVHQLLHAWLTGAPNDKVAMLFDKARGERLGPPLVEAAASLREALRNGTAAKEPSDALEIVQVLGPAGLRCPTVERWLEARGGE